ncbi:MAG: sulfatase [Phenylobacterium sp.]|nr:sulfatase [Phenylobacterium sp.]
MHRRNLLKAGAAAAALPGLARAAPARRPPNFIVILCDDLGYGDIEPYGGAIPTPALARMAREGLVATSYYAPANLCTPSRAGLLTGRYPVRTGLGFEVIFADDDRKLPHSERTIADALKPAGYVSGLFGKWHLGHQGADWLPTTYGFDAYFGIPYSHDMSPLSLWAADAAHPKGVSGPVDYAALQQQFQAHAESFIEQARDRPFFVELAFSAPHLPEHPDARFKGTSKQGPYGDTVRELDALVGRLMDRLRTLKLERDTYVIFTSDNGPWFEGSAGPLRGRKGGGADDGGYRVPFLVWAPGRVKPGRRSDAILSGVDILPTLCALAGVAPPAGVELDGVDQSRVWLAGAPSARDEIVLFNNEDVIGIRTQRWKYVAASYYRSLTLNFEQIGSYLQLYDETQGAENYSVAATYPEAAADLRGRLHRAADRYKPFKRGVPPAVARLLRAVQAGQRQD